MWEPESEIIDFYPIKFPLDTNGFKFAWMGVNLLPFVNEQRLLKAVRSRQDQFTEGETKRNTTGCEQLMFNFEHIPTLALLLDKCAEKDFCFEIKNEDGHRLFAKLKHFEDPYILDAPIKKPKPEMAMGDIPENKVVSLRLDLPYSSSHP